ncbi:alpha/beta hydrolase [Yersinia enterocolitica]|uniref:LysR substrate-binding domain-containing protein n=1 Tax=Yersinia enterocolitica TaxID=630 RepID=UPI0005DE704B|nr:LysR substrate-binding domain-containing protein [Yersinia enterocolitica]CQH09634.1 alpha/beta hydrolase [Yersinia enterocolitica]
MDLRHLRCFLAVAEELHFARAAEKLHIEQSPLSRTIKELEEDLGEQLFIRTSRSTRLTRAGKLFLEHVPRIFTALQQARDSVQAAANGFHGQLRIALSDGITPSRLPTLLALCRQEEPEIEIRLFEVPLSQQIKGLHDDLYDVGFSQSDEVGEGITAEAVWSDVLMVAVPARHPLLRHKRIPLEDVLRHPLVLCDPQVCEGYTRQVDRVLRRMDNDERTAKRISETLGTATELRAQRNYAGHRLAPWLGHLMVSRQETARPLLTPGEVMQLPTDEAVVMVSSVAPIKAKKLRYFADANFKQRVLPPPAVTAGRYSLKAAQTDKRFKALATLSMFDSGLVRRNGYQDSQLSTIQDRLKQASDARAKEVATGEITYTGDAQLTDEQIAKLPFDLYRQGFEYYGKIHAHPNSTFRYTLSSLLDLMSFDAQSNMDLINQSLLMIAGTKADSRYMTESAFKKATGTQNKELFLIDGATHIETYWVPRYVDQAMSKIDNFFDKNI